MCVCVRSCLRWSYMKINWCPNICLHSKQDISTWHLIAKRKPNLSQNALLITLHLSVNYSTPEAIDISSQSNSQIYWESLHLSFKSRFSMVTHPSFESNTKTFFFSPVCCNVFLWAEPQIIFLMFCHRNLWSKMFSHFIFPYLFHS